MAKKNNIHARPVTEIMRREWAIRAEWNERATKKNEQIVGDGYAERQMADTLAKAGPIITGSDQEHPAADQIETGGPEAVDVVRCRDCLWAIAYETDDGLFCDYLQTWMHPDEYCSSGKR